MTEDNGAGPAETPTADGEDNDELIPDDAFISPDEPIVRRPKQAVPDDAFISPDDPIERKADTEGMVVGMDGSMHHRATLKAVHLEPEHVARILEDTAHLVREDGVRAGLNVGPDATHFEAMLKAYLAGYFSTS